MLREALPKIVTGTLPGPKAKAVLDRRAAAVPNGIGTAYKAVIERGEGAMFAVSYTHLVSRPYV